MHPYLNYKHHFIRVLLNNLSTYYKMFIMYIVFLHVILFCLLIRLLNHYSQYLVSYWLGIKAVGIYECVEFAILISQ